MTDFKRLCLRFPPDLYRQRGVPIAATAKTQTKVLVERIQGACQRIHFKGRQDNTVEEVVTR